MLSLGRVNRLASLAILPLMALAFAFAWRMQDPDGADADLPREGVLVIANLRAESLTFADLTTPAPTLRALAVLGPPHEMVALNRRLYVTLGHAGLVLEVDPRAPGVLRELEYSEAIPHGIAASDEKILVTFDDLNLVEVLNPKTLGTEDAFGTGDTPHAVAFDDSGVYITDSRDDQLRRIAGDAPPILAATGALPESVTLADDRVVTADADGRSLSVFRRGTLEPLGRIDLPGRPVRVIPLGDHRVLAALNDTGEVALIDLEALRLERRIAVGERPDGLCLSPSGAYVAVVSNADDRADIFRVSDWRPAGTIATPDGPGACVWLASQ